MQLTRLYLALLIISILIFYLLYLLTPDAQNFLTQEDGFLENLSALLLFVSFSLGTIIILQLQRKSIFSLKKNGFYYLIPVLSLLGFLDEISFGERLLGFEFTQVVKGVKVDGIHDIFSISYKFLILEILKNQLKTGNYFLLTIILIIITTWFLLLFNYHKLVSSFIINCLHKHLAFRFLLATMAFFSLATIIDVGVFSTLRGMGLLIFLDPEIFKVVEEISEVYVALSCLFMTLATHYQYNRKLIKSNY